ncbi:MAG: ribosome small subunit-dependent GTPase A [bacterium]|nr:ribosome small subunit-dependent GTPase A [bacterium]
MTNYKKLEKLGWDKFFEKNFEKFSKEGLSPARVAIEHKQSYVVYTGDSELTAEVSGKFHYNVKSPSEYPAVGDWVVIREIPDEKKAIIETVLERKNKFSRKEAGIKLNEQIIAANIDYLFFISSLNQDISLRRMERYLTLSIENKVTPVIIMSKEDLCDDTEEKIAEVKTIAEGIDVYALSAVENTGIEALRKYFEENKTVAVVGSSGVGKSTLINCLADSEKMDVSEISLYKDKGRHTTTHRELILLPEGGIIIDTPGMRELQLWEGGDGASETFKDVEKYLGQCRFSDCKHETEPGCAIKEAIANGEFDQNRFDSYLKLQREITWFENRQNNKFTLAEKKKWKKLTSDAKRTKK